MNSASDSANVNSETNSDVSHCEVRSRIILIDDAFAVRTAWPAQNYLSAFAVRRPALKLNNSPDFAIRTMIQIII